jgi:hypothetical protein
MDGRPGIALTAVGQSHWAGQIEGQTQLVFASHSEHESTTHRARAEVASVFVQPEPCGMALGQTHDARRVISHHLIAGIRDHERKLPPVLGEDRNSRIAPQRTAGAKVGYADRSRVLTCRGRDLAAVRNSKRRRLAVGLGVGAGVTVEATDPGAARQNEGQRRDRCCSEQPLLVTHVEKLDRCSERICLTSGRALAAGSGLLLGGCRLVLGLLRLGDALLERLHEVDDGHFRGGLGRLDLLALELRLEHCP